LEDRLIFNEDENEEKENKKEKELMETLYRYTDWPISTINHRLKSNSVNRIQESVNFQDLLGVESVIESTL